MNNAQADAAPRRWLWRPWRLGHALATGVLALVLVGFSAVPARAHVHLFIGGVFGLPLPVYSYAPAYPYPPIPSYAYSVPYYPPYPVNGGYAIVAPPVPPRVWVRGHWAWRSGPWHRRARVWVPAHWR